VARSGDCPLDRADCGHIDGPVLLGVLRGEGFPNIFRLPWRESLSVLLMSAVVAGLLLAWKWEGLGGAVALAGMVLFMLLTGTRGIGLFLVPAAIGLLHVVCWWRLRSGGAGWEVPGRS